MNFFQTNSKQNRNSLVTVFQLILSSWGSCRPILRGHQDHVLIFYIIFNTYLSSVGSETLLCGVIDPRPVSYVEHCVTPHMTILYYAKPQCDWTILKGQTKLQKFLWQPSWEDSFFELWTALQSLFLFIVQVDGG